MKLFSPGDQVRILYHGVYQYGEVTIVSQLGVKVLWNNAEWAYWYCDPEELELVIEEDLSDEVHD